MTDHHPRPNLSSDEAYLAKVKGLIKSQEPLEELHFEYLTEVFKELGITKDVYESVSSTFVPEQTRVIIDEAFELVKSKILDDELIKRLYKLWDYLAESDPLGKADLIYVFGGISELAVLESIRLKKENYAPKILFSGKQGSYMKDTNDFSEAEKYSQLAVEKGVSQDDILLEKESVNTVENVVNSSKLLHTIGYLPKTIIAVSLPYHMKRASLTLRAGMDISFKLIRHSGCSAKYSRETYFEDKNGWSYVCNEYVKLYMARRGGHF